MAYGIRSELQKHGSLVIVLALVGNKADLQEKREVSVQDGMEYAEKNGMFFIKTSAKPADNINQLFELRCPSCKTRMNTEASYVIEADGGGFVTEAVTNMIMDDLEVKPMSTISSITMLNKFNAKVVGDSEEKVVSLEMK